MRTALFAAALLAGTAAFAQDTVQTTDHTMHNTNHTMTTPPADAQDVTTAPMTTPAPTTTSTMTSADTWAASTGTSVAPGNADPERDARGIAVISDPASAPAGFNQQPGMGGPVADPSQPPPSQPATDSYQACSRTVTDNCVQTYERGRSPRR